MKNNIHKGIATAMLIVFGFFLTSCMSNNSNEILIKLDKNKTVILKMDQVLKIELKSNPTTGYQWVLKNQTPNIITQTGSSEYFMDKNNDGRVGSGGVQAYGFKPLEQGEATLSFTYERPWEKGVPPAEKYDLKTVIR